MTRPCIYSRTCILKVLVFFIWLLLWCIYLQSDGDDTFQPLFKWQIKLFLIFTGELKNRLE